MDTPQEIEVWYVLPALRRQFVLAFKEHGLRQKEIAKIMTISEAAVSQYLKNKRGSKVRFSENFISNIKKSARKIIENRSDFRKELQITLNLVRTVTCSMCHTRLNTDKNCKICR